MDFDSRMVLYFLIAFFIMIISFISTGVIGMAQDKSLRKAMESSSYVLRYKREHINQFITLAIICFLILPFPVLFLFPEDDPFFQGLIDFAFFAVCVLLFITFTIIYIYCIRWKVVVYGGTMTIMKPFFKPVEFSLTHIVKVKEAAKHIYDDIRDFHVDGYVIHVKEPGNDVKKVLKINDEYMLGLDVFRAHMLAINAPIEKRGLVDTTPRKRGKVSRFFWSVVYYVFISIPTAGCIYLAVTSWLDGWTFAFVVATIAAIYFGRLVYLADKQRTAKVDICDKGVTFRYLLFGKIFMPWSECAHIVLNVALNGGNLHCTIHFSKAPLTEKQIKDMYSSKEQLHVEYSEELLEKILKYVDRSKIKNLHILEEALENREK